MHPLPLAALKIFFLNLVFRSLIRVWIKVGFFALILFEVHIACWTCRFILFIKLETLSAIMFPNAFSVLFFLLSTWDSHDMRLDSTPPRPSPCRSLRLFVCLCLFVYLFILVCFLSLFRLSKFSQTILKFTDSVPSRLLLFWAHPANFRYLGHFSALWSTLRFF